MILGKVSLLLHLSAIFGVFAITTAVVLTVFKSHLIDHLKQYSPTARKAWFWCIGFLPIIVGLLVTTFVMLPSIRYALFASCPECHVHSDAYEHLCWYHPMTFSLLSWQGFFLLGITAFLGLALIRAAVSAFATGRYSNELLAFAEPTERGYCRLDSDIPCALTIGLSKPRCFISSFLERALSEDELDVVAQHEIEHVRNHDPLKQFVFRLLCSIFPTMSFVKEMELAREQCADLAVTEKISDRALIASTMLTVGKMSRYSSNLVAGLAINGFGASTLEQRIRFLLSHCSGSPFPAWRLLMVLTAVVAAGTASGDAVHYAVEYLLAY
jgi:Zn-dependent protease with chaperone function